MTRFNLDVTISGPAASGKTRLSTEITAFLRRNNVPYMLYHADVNLWDAFDGVNIFNYSTKEPKSKDFPVRIKEITLHNVEPETNKTESLIKELHIYARMLTLYRYPPLVSHQELVEFLSMKVSVCQIEEILLKAETTGYFKRTGSQYTTESPS